MKIEIPEVCLVVLIGPSGCGKSTFARNHFRSTEIISSDFCRGMISDNENDLSINQETFELLHYLVDLRLRKGRLTVVDATNVQPQSRKQLIDLARKNDVLPVAFVFTIREEICQERNVLRPDRNFGPHVIKAHIRDLRRGIGGLKREFKYVHFLDTPEIVDSVEIDRTRVWTNLKHEKGPFDIIGDIHGCYDELVALLAKLENDVSEAEPTLECAPESLLNLHSGHPTDRSEILGNRESRIEHQVPNPEGGGFVVPPLSESSIVNRESRIAPRKLIFLGDLVDRGPDSPAVLRLVMRLVKEGRALCVPGNHDIKLLRALKGAKVSLGHGLAETLAQLEIEPAEFRAEVVEFLNSLISHYVLDDGRLVVAHAGMRAEYQGRASGRVREFALYGETTGETDEFGLPVRFNWASEYRGDAMVVYGHTPVPEAEWLNRTICIDTGCVFGGKLTALRYPERELVDVPAARVYSEPIRPLIAAQSGTAQHLADDILDVSEVAGRRHIRTRIMSGTITLREENATAALEIMSRFAVDPRWLVYLPPTMSPSETSKREGYLEYPDEALQYYANAGISNVICEEKHMGSRSVVVLCRDAEVARRRFGVVGEDIGVITTRTGRRFFENVDMEQNLLRRIVAAADKAKLWDELASDWMVLDCELMPWSAKAQDLLRRQYAPVGAAARTSLGYAVENLDKLPPDLATSSNDEALAARTANDFLAATQLRLTMADQYVDAYRRYCWSVQSLDDYKLAPFHLLASEGAVHTDKDHVWHMHKLAELAEHDPVLVATPFRVVDLQDSVSRAAAVEWWEELVGKGGEGMVVKPLSFIARDAKGLLQPALKCRGPEYLRIIYGPEYSREENLARLRQRGLAAKRGLALREFSLGIEALHRFIDRDPLRQVHECVFGVLAFESEPVDPRL